MKSKTFPALSGQVHESEGSRIGSQFEAKVKWYYIMLWSRTVSIMMQQIGCILCIYYIGDRAYFVSNLINQSSWCAAQWADGYLVSKLVMNIYSRCTLNVLTYGESDKRQHSLCLQSNSIKWASTTMKWNEIDFKVQEADYHEVECRIVHYHKCVSIACNLNPAYSKLKTQGHAEPIATI